MLLPGSKGWINKYFSLIEEGTLVLNYQTPRSISAQRHLHLLSGKTGLIFGHPSRFLFFKDKDYKRWTQDEKIKFLLFETLLLVYIQKHGITPTLKEDFLESVLKFYASIKSKGIQSLFSIFTKESGVTRVETIFSSRIDVSRGFFDNRYWFKTISNVFIYLDVILYNRFVNEADVELEDLYPEYAFNSVISIILAGQSDGQFDENEETIFKTFMSAANLDGDFKEKAIISYKIGARYADFTPILKEDKLFRRFLLDLGLLTAFGNSDINRDETSYLSSELSEFLELDGQDVEESFTMIENFLLYSDARLSFLNNNKIYERVYTNFTARWTKVILRNKDKLALELSESKELVSLIKKSATQELSNDEKEKVKTQFLDLAKSMPALAIFMLPGGAILLPLILKVLPTLIPSAFRDNEI